MSISFLNQDQGDGVEQFLNTDHVVFPNSLDMDMGRLPKWGIPPVIAI